MLPGDLIEAYHHGYLKAESLNKWAMELLDSNFEND